MKDAGTEPLAPHHRLEGFDCGDDHLNTWLVKRARRNEGKYARTFVVCDDEHQVIGFYCLAAGAIDRSTLSKTLQRNAPELLPVTILGRLAVDVSCQGHGIGRMLLVDAFRRSLHAAETVGTRLMLLHAKDDHVRKYYMRFGFRPLPEYPLTMVLPMETIAAALAD